MKAVHYYTIEQFITEYGKSQAQLLGGLCAKYSVIFLVIKDKQSSCFDRKTDRREIVRIANLTIPYLMLTAKW